MASKKSYTKEFKEEAVELAQQNGNIANPHNIYNVSRVRNGNGKMTIEEYLK